MSLSVLAAIAVAIVAAFVWIRSFRVREAERAEEYRKAAHLRGWHLGEEREQVRYSGTTHGIPWTFVTARRPGRGSDDKNVSRWHTSAVRADEPVIVWSKHTPAAVRGELLELGKKLVYRALAGVMGLAPEALANAHFDPALQAIMDQEDMPLLAAVLHTDGLTLVGPAVVSDPVEVEKIVRAGVRLARARTQPR